MQLILLRQSRNVTVVEITLKFVFRYLDLDTGVCKFVLRDALSFYNKIIISM